jgi:hypothetical protein
VYRGVEEKRKVHEQGVILRDGEVVHHDAVRNGDRYRLSDDAVLGHHTVDQVRSLLLVCKKKHFTWGANISPEGQINSKFIRPQNTNNSTSIEQGSYLLSILDPKPQTLNTKKVMKIRTCSGVQFWVGCERVLQPLLVVFKA